MKILLKFFNLSFFILDFLNFRAQLLEPVPKSLNFFKPSFFFFLALECYKFFFPFELKSNLLGFIKNPLFFFGLPGKLLLS